MKLLCPVKTGIFLTVVLLATSMPVAAQKYKEDFNSAQEAAKGSLWADARNLFFSAATGADEAADSEVAQRARYAVAQIDYKMGTTAFKAEDFETALKHYSDGETIYPAYIKNVYGKGLALRKLGREEEALDNFMAASAAPGDRKTSLAAENQIRDHFISQASTRLAKRNATRADADAALTALASLTQLMEADSDTYYYTAQAHYVKGDWASAISAAEQALAIHNGSRTDKAKIYYVLGESYVSINDRGAAKNAFQNALYGAYKLSAEHYLETL
ncbi:MAG: hypothetical protein OXE92_02815 [Bacteroidetes bacterium]|nr:hypothetical protein [Bacteroidota bacterium]MCY4204640.1 hypothetical protein [Bacteroidota bacterium]